MPTEDSIQRLLNWFNEHLPQVVEQLNDPATEAEIDALENAFGHKLPDELRALYLRFNGQPDHSSSAPGMFYGLGMHSAANAQADWESWVSVLGGFDDSDMTDFQESGRPGFVKAVYANRGWLPIAQDWGGNFLGIDFDPGPNGTVGQVINAGRDEEVKQVIANSFSEFLEWYVNQLEQGNFLIESNGASFGTKNPPGYGLLDAAQVMFSPSSRFEKGPLYAPTRHGPPPEEPESLNLLNQRSQKFVKQLEATDGLSFEVRDQALLAFNKLFVSRGTDFRLADQEAHEQELAFAIDGAFKSKQDKKPEKISQSWELAHQFLLDESIIDHDRFNAVEAVRTDKDGRRDEILSKFVIEGGPGFYRALSKFDAGAGMMPPGMEMFGKRLDSLAQWLKSNHPDLPLLQREVISRMMMQLATIAGPPTESINLKMHEMLLAQSVSRIDTGSIPPEVPADAELRKPIQISHCWKLLHQWMRETEVIDQNHFEAVESVRLNTDGRIDEVLRGR